MLSNDVKVRIIDSFKEGFSIRAISRNMRVHRKTVSSVISEWIGRDSGVVIIYSFLILLQSLNV